VYKAAKYKAPAPLELVVWTMAETFGWTLEYIDSLPLKRLHEWIAIQDGRAKAMPQPGGKTARKGRR
jgi:hypothetical protein